LIRSGSRRLVACLAFWPAAALACCGSSEPFQGTVSRSQSFEYHDEIDEPLCGTLLEQLDLHARVIGGKVGFTPDQKSPIRFFRFRDEASFSAHSNGCPPENGACALDGDVYSVLPFHAHEQAHAYVFHAWGERSNGLLDEGEAVALSCEPFLVQPAQVPRDVLSPPDWRDLLTLHGNSDSGYVAAGYLVTSLVDQYGWQRLAELHQRVAWSTSAEDFQAEFAAVYPLSIDEAWSNALGRAGARPCQPDWACMGTPMTLGEQAQPECDGYMHRSIVVQGQGGVVLAIAGQDINELTLMSCADTASTQYVLDGLYGVARAVHWALMPPGSYAMLGAPLPSAVQLVSSLPHGWVADACDGAGALTLDPAADTYVDLLPGRVDGWLRVAGGYGTYMASVDELAGATPDPVVFVCDGCPAAGACVPIPAGTLTPVTLGASSFVHFQGAIAEPSPASAWAHFILRPAVDGAAPP
jgi:hypothetical protein